MRIRSVAAATITALIAVTLPATPASATDAAIALGVSTFRHILLDDAHSHVFVSAANGVVVRDLEGGAVTTITNEPGAAQMALSADGSQLYVALLSGDGVSVIDTTTLTETARYATGANTCPASLAVTSGKIWFGYGCSGAPGQLGVIDPSATPATVTLYALPGSSFYYAPGLAASPAKPGLLVAGDYGQSPATLRLIDVSSGSAGVVASTSPGSNLTDFAITADGADVITASGWPYYHQAYKTTDLSMDGAFGSNNPYPNAVATGAGGLVAAGLLAYSSPDIVIYKSDATFIRSYELGGCCIKGQSGSLAPRGLAFSADASRLYAISQDYQGNAVELRVFHDPGKADSTLALTPPTSAAINKAFTISGALSSGSPITAGQNIAVHRDSAYGSADLPTATTSSTGTFSLSDTVAKRGAYTYTITWAGDATHEPTSARLVVNVIGVATALTITTPVGPYLYNAKPLIVAHLGTTKVRTLSVYATPYGGSRRLLKTGTVDAHGNLSVGYLITRRTVFTAVFGGDDTYEPASYSRTLLSHARVITALGGYYARSGSYHLVHNVIYPWLDMTVSPNNYSSCTSYRAQRYYSGTWHTVSTQSCIPLNNSSQALAEFYGSHPIGGLYRVSGAFNGSTRNVATAGPWWYIKFTT